MIDRALWQEARPLFDELVELGTEARIFRLEEIGAKDPELKMALERLLTADTGPETESASDGGPPTTPRDRQSSDPLSIIGKTVSHFAVKSYLAAGGMGVVYTAEDVQLGRTVALKFPLPHQQMDKLIKERFINEARSAAALDHPNLCAVYEVGESEHGVFLAMPLYAGETVKARLMRESTLAPDEALRIAEQITVGLTTAHAAGIVHRDLKPANVMLLPDGTVKVLDFGLAKVRDINLTLSRATLGTISYVAPEQVRGSPADARTDLWSIGVMLHEMLTGLLPFGGENELSILHSILYAEPARASVSRSAIPAVFDQLIGTLLQKNPDDRYPSAEALLLDLKALRSGTRLSHRSPFWTRTPSRRRLRRSLPMVTVGVLLVAGVVSWSVYNELAHSPTVVSGRTAIAFVNGSATIRTAAQLVAALSPANAGRRIHMTAGTYDVDRTLSVPDGITLEGEGVMLFDPDGHAVGFRDGPHTRLRVRTTMGGNLLTLGNHVMLRKLEIADVNGRSGNVVAIESRRAADSVSVTIVESVIVNPNFLSIGPGGPLGRALEILSRNANMGSAPAPDSGSVINVKVSGSVIRSPSGGGGVFAYNFAPSSRIWLDISRSVIGGGNEAGGGVSRPDAVHDSEVRLTSRDNVYRNEWTSLCAQALVGWNLNGGSGAPFPITVPETKRNRLVMRSENDRLEGFTTGILATGARRFFAAPRNGASIDNRVELQLVHTTISTPVCRGGVRSENTSGSPMMSVRPVADLQLIGGNVATDGLDPGERNVVRADLREVTGSGARANKYANVGGAWGILASATHANSNRLEIAGDPQTFARSNHGIDPAPGRDFFALRR